MHFNLRMRHISMNWIIFYANLMLTGKTKMMCRNLGITIEQNESGLLETIQEGLVDHVI